VEVGSWKGASAIHMAGLCREFGLATALVCIDTWLGSSEHALGRRSEWRESLQPRHGYPQLYYTFLANVVRSGHAGAIVPLPNTSEHAAIVLGEKQLFPDLVYIDASHHEPAVYRDLSAYWALLRPGGALVGDDFAKFPGVRRAALRFAAAVGREIEDHGDKFVLRRADEGPDDGGRHGTARSGVA
jgi:predicted O-methyltransferase YrrM